MASKNKFCYLIADNFMAYYKAHTHHLNVTGPNFDQYHSLFGEVYGKLWEWHDTLSEQLRQAGEKYPLSLKGICDESAIPDVSPSKSVSGMLDDISHDLGALLTHAENVYATADPALETVIGDYCADVKKLKWKIDATIGK
jgi:DNA-binding ferritin-like protein